MSGRPALPARRYDAAHGAMQDQAADWVERCSWTDLSAILMKLAYRDPRHVLAAIEELRDEGRLIAGEAAL